MLLIGEKRLFLLGIRSGFLRKIDDIANPFCDGWFRAGGSKEKISGSDFKIRATNFKKQGTYFLPSENYFENRPGMQTK